MPAKSKLARGLRALPKAEPSPEKEKQIESFIGAESPRRGSPRRPTSLRTRRPSGGTRVTVYVPDELLRRLQTVAFNSRRSVSDMATEAIERLVEASERKAVAR